MCHFAAKIPAPHDQSNMLKVHAGPRNPPVGQSLWIESLCCSGAMQGCALFTVQYGAGLCREGQTLINSKERNLVTLF